MISIKCWSDFPRFALAVCALGLALRSLAASPHVFDVRDYGALGDGKHLETSALNAAIDACTASGGGRVYLPPGTYLSGTVILKSRVTFELEAGATLLGSEDPNDYVPQGVETGPGRLAPLVYAADAEKITITGRGTIDGQGSIWWKKLRDSLGSPAEARSYSDRPYLVRPLRCTDLVIEQVTLKNSASWTLNPVLCERVRIDGVSVVSEKSALNTDGINPDSCRNVQILNCRVDTGDDCITLKSGLDVRGRLRDRPCEDITISNCVMYRGHGGIVIGSEMSGGVRNVTVSNCVFHGTDNGIRVKSQRGRGGVVEGLTVTNIVMQNVPTPIIITTFYSGTDQPSDVFPVGEGTPRFRDFLFSNLTAREARTAGSITGLKEMPVENITFSNVHIQADTGFVCSSARDIVFLDTVIDTMAGPALKLDNSSGIVTERLSTRRPHPETKLVESSGENTAPVATIGNSPSRPSPSAAAESPPSVALSLPVREVTELGMVLIGVPAGSFVMGSPSTERGHEPAEEPKTEVTIRREFWIGRYEVTQGEWKKVMGTSPAHFHGDDLPVEQISWFEAVEFCRKLTEKERTGGRLPAGYEYALPTEAQWEYACRAGTRGPYGGTGAYDQMAWNDLNAGKRTHAVGGKAANAWGLFDMHGNVWEWCRDRAGPYPGGKVSDYAGAPTGRNRVFRGGSFWPYDRGEGRSAYRNWVDADTKASRLGFRVALCPES